MPFNRACHSMGFHNVKRLWDAIDTDCSGFITLYEWEPVAAQNLLECRNICVREYGNIEHAFKMGMDRMGSGALRFQDLAEFCRKNDFAGDVRVLFSALDEQGTGLITADEARFLAVSGGERFSRLNKGQEPPRAPLRAQQTAFPSHTPRRPRPAGGRLPPLVAE